MTRAKKIGIAVAIGFTGFIIYRLFLMYQMMHASHQFPPAVVSTAVVKSENLPRYLPAIGTLNSANAITVTSEVAGRISKVAFTSGQEVEKGALLVQLDDEVEQAELNRHKATLHLAEINLKRVSSLASQNVESKATLDQKQTAYQESLAQVNQSQAVINRKQIRAPFAGKLGIDHTNVGQYIQPGTPLVTLTDLNTLNVDFARPEQDWPLIELGFEVLVTADAFPNKVFRGKITAVEPVIKDETRMINIRASLSNPDKTLMPGMFAPIKVELPAKLNSLIIPETAIDYSLYGTTVFVVNNKKDEKSGKDMLIAERRQIEVGSKHNGLVEISKGLKAGEQVITAGQLKIDNGMPVVVNNNPELKPKETYTY
jgi:RND family efflux transporter MFP subunit